MLQALNTGHEGSLSTAHANSPHHLLWRLETMALMSDVDLPAAHIREQVASAVDVVVHMARLRDGRRVALHVSAVEGCVDGEPVVREVFSFHPRAGGGAQGEFVAAGVVPELTEVLAERGEPIPAALFAEGSDRPGGHAEAGTPLVSLERIPIGASNVPGGAA
jgi:pilus assembly protein CpaF